MKSIFTPAKMWLKGNLHAHTTVSDGNYSPEQIIKMYEQQDYDFMMISDHEVYSDYKQTIPTTMTMIPGYEASGKKNPRYQNSIYHLLVISKSEEPLYKHGTRFSKFDDSSIASVQTFIDQMIAQNHIVILAHPHWSTLEYDEILKLNNLTGVEIYNGASDVLHNVGNSVVCYDALLRNGSELYALATDDNHNGNGQNDDSFKGWIEVYAHSNSVEDITKAIACGNFYASTGPQIVDVRYDSENVEIDFKQGATIYLHDQARNGQVENLKRDLNGTVKFKLNGYEKFVRLEVINANGQCAWTNPIYLR